MVKNLYLDACTSAESPFTNNKDRPVTPLTDHTSPVPDPDDIWDAKGFIFCVHGREFCELCSTDHRVTNELRRRKNVSDAEMEEVYKAFEQLSTVERQLQDSLHSDMDENKPLEKRLAHELMSQIYGTPSLLEQLPSWPPVYTGEVIHSLGTQVVLKGLKSRTDLNGTVGTIGHLIKGKKRYCIQLPGGGEVSVAMANVDVAYGSESDENKENGDISNKHEHSDDSPSKNCTTIKTIQELEKILKTCKDGATIFLGPGHFKPTNGALEIVIPGVGLILQGSTSGKTVLDVTLKTTVGAKGVMLAVKNLHVLAGFDIEDNEYSAVIVSDCHFECGRERNCVKIGTCKRRCLFRNCVINGGSDGLRHESYETDLEIDRCEIRNAYSRGIFANSEFVIRDSVVRNCGGYGIKCRRGCTALGACDIQPGPWDSPWRSPYGTNGLAGGVQHGDGSYAYLDRHALGLD